MNRFILSCLLVFVSLGAFAQYSGTGPITLSTPAGVSGIQWYKDGTAVTSATSASFVTSLPGTYYASYTDATTNCTDDRTIFFVLLASGTTITLDGASNTTGGSAYQWNNAGTDITGATSSTYNTGTGGLYQLSYNNGSCVVNSAKYHVFVFTSTSTAAGTIDCSKTQIVPAPVAGTASQVDLVVTVNVATAGTLTPIIVSGSGMSVANGITSVSTTTTGIQTFHIPIKYDGSALGTLSFTVGNAGSCTADLTKTPRQAISNVWTLDCIPTVGPSLK